MVNNRWGVYANLGLMLNSLTEHARHREERAVRADRVVHGDGQRLLGSRLQCLWAYHQAAQATLIDRRKEGGLLVYGSR